MWHAILHFIGADNLSGPWYGFWSGFGSDIGEVAIIGAIFKVVNCHAKGCWRLGFHHVADTPFKTCRKHHPTGGNTHAHILALHRRNKDA